MRGIPVKRVHGLITGFLQHKGQPTGLYKIYRQLRTLQTDPETQVFLWEYDANFNHIAEHIWRITQNGTSEKPDIRVYSYSWGTGLGVLGRKGLARMLDRRGLAIRHLANCDGVYGAPYIWQRWRAFWPGSRLVIPPSIKSVVSVRQRQSRLRGHPLEAADPSKTVILSDRVLNYHHEYIDDSPEFFNLCWEIARG